MESTTGKKFADFWGYAIDKGLMKPATARSLQAAVRQVLRVEENWEEIDVSQFDVDRLLLRFRNTRAQEYKPESLAEYERRFKKALDLFLAFVSDPSGWKYEGQGTSTRKSSRERANEMKKPQDEGDSTPIGSSVTTPQGVQMLDYQFPLRENCIARLRLPADLKVTEVERLAAFMRPIAVDFAIIQNRVG